MLNYLNCVSWPFKFKVMKVLLVFLFACHSLWPIGIRETPKVALVSVSKLRMTFAVFITRPNVIYQLFESLSASSLVQTGLAISHFKLNRH